MSTATETPTEPAEKSDVATGDSDHLVKTINFRFQRLYGNVTMLVGGIWLAVFALGFFTIEKTWVLAFIGIGSFLLGLFALRLGIHLRSAPLLQEVAEFRTEHNVTLEELLTTAREMSPPADFFVSLVDGPLARQRRERQESQE